MDPPRSLVQGLNLSYSTGGQCLLWASPLFFFQQWGQKGELLVESRAGLAVPRVTIHHEVAMSVSQRQESTKLSPTGLQKGRLSTGTCEKHLGCLQRRWAR